MADNFTFPIGSNSYVPTLSADLIVEYSMNPDKFPVNKYINTRKIDKQRGFYVKMRNDNQVRSISSPQDVAWPDGNDVPQLTYGNDAFEYLAYDAKRYAYVRRLGALSVDQGSWDLLGQASRLAAMEGMVNRVRRIHSTLSTTGNYPTANQITASVTGGAVWGSATNTAPSIRKCLTTAFNTIMQSTNGVVNNFNDLYVIMNPNTAQVAATSSEVINTFIQSPLAINEWQGDQQFIQYGLPSKFLGANLVVDPTVYQGTQVAASTQTKSYTFPDNVCVVMTKQQAITPSASGAFSSYELFVYEDFSVFVHFDTLNRVYRVIVSEILDDSFIFAPDSAVIIATNS